MHVETRKRNPTWAKDLSCCAEEDACQGVT